LEKCHAIDFKDAKQILFFTFFSHNLPTGTSSSVLEINFLLKFCVKNIVLQALFQSAQHIYEKWEGSGSGSGRPQNMRIRIPNTGTSV
jgi:hypothetical protein